MTNRPGWRGTWGTGAAGAGRGRLGRPPHTHSVVSRATTSPRLTIPASRWPLVTGTRRIRRSTSRWRTSSRSVSLLTVITDAVITSLAVSPPRASRSYSLTRPTTAPPASTTGTPLIRLSRSRPAITGTGVFPVTVTTRVVMISLTFTCPHPSRADPGEVWCRKAEGGERFPDHLAGEPPARCRTSS
jgi:hypothetical protein